VLIQTDKYLHDLNTLVSKYEFPLENIEVVPNIQEWCKTKGLVEDNPFRIGKCLKNRTTEKYKILLVSEITDDMQSSVLGGMLLSHDEDETDILLDPKYFVTHLLLHEIAHARNGSWTEYECDKWAFNEIKENAI
jgi:hypothetical protein